MLMVEIAFLALQILEVAIVATLVGWGAAKLSKRRWLGWVAAAAVVAMYVRLWFFTDPPP